MPVWCAPHGCNHRIATHTGTTNATHCLPHVFTSNNAGWDNRPHGCCIAPTSNNHQQGRPAYWTHYNQSLSPWLANYSPFPPNNAGGCGHALYACFLQVQKMVLAYAIHLAHGKAIPTGTILEMVHFPTGQFTKQTNRGFSHASGNHAYIELMLCHFLAYNTYKSSIQWMPSYTFQPV